MFLRQEDLVNWLLKNINNPPKTGRAENMLRVFFG